MNKILEKCIANIVLWRVSQAMYRNTNRIVTKCIVTPLTWHRIVWFSNALYPTSSKNWTTDIWGNPVHYQLHPAHIKFMLNQWINFLVISAPIPDIWIHDLEKIMVIAKLKINSHIWGLTLIWYIHLSFHSNGNNFCLANSRPWSKWKLRVAFET